jgi:hypothetical protein
MIHSILKTTFFAKCFLKDNELIFLNISEFYFSNNAKVDQVGNSTFQVWTFKAAGGVKQPFNSFRFKTKTMICWWWLPRTVFERTTQHSEDKDRYCQLKIIRLLKRNFEDEKHKNIEAERILVLTWKPIYYKTMTSRLFDDMAS